MKYPALSEKSNRTKKAYQMLISIWVYTQIVINLSLKALHLTPVKWSEVKVLKESVETNSKTVRKNGTMKSDLQTLRKVHKFLIEFANPKVVKALNTALLGQELLISKSHSYVTAVRLKEDFLIIKSFFLIGKIVPVDQRGT